MLEFGGTHAPRREEWYALYTKPFAERQVSDALTARGIEVYLPTLPVWRARRRQVESEPLFPCYTFALINWSKNGMSEVSWLPGLRWVVQMDGRPIPIPDTVIHHLRERTSKPDLEAAQRFQPGSHVRIQSGPLQDLEAIFMHPLSGQERAAILVQVLGRLARCDIPMVCLA